MTKAVILITSATSRNAAYAAKMLLAATKEDSKYTVRLGARNPDKLEEFVAQGAEAVVLDHSKPSSVRQAFRGVDAVYMVLPTLVGGEDDLMFKSILQEAKECGTVKHIVYLSAIDAAAPTDEFRPIHNHYANEQAIVESGIPFTILRPTFFHENTVAYRAESVKRSGEFASSAGDGVWTSVAICDIAAVAVAALRDPRQHAGKTYTLTEEALTDGQLAEKISKAIGKPVKHVNLSPEEHTELLKKHYAGPKDPDEFADGLVRLDRQKRNSQFSVVCPDLEQVLGRKGISLDEFVAEHADAFKD